MNKSQTTIQSIRILSVLALGGPLAAFAQSAQTPQSSKQVAQARIEQERVKAQQDANSRAVAEALSAVQETRAAAQALDQNQTQQARAALERAVGKADLVLANHPNLALVPLSAEVQIIDTQVDDPTIKRLTGNAKNLVEQGRYQPARLLLQELASEMDVMTINLPVVTYPVAIHSAARLMDQGKPQEAKSQLLAALDSLVMTESIIPLPVIRAQALVDEVSKQADAKKIDKAQANQYLDEADRQVALADKLGYGSSRQDFASLQSSIKNVKSTLNGNRETGSVLAKLKDSLQSLKQKISGTA